MNPLLDCDAIDEPALNYLRRIGRVFAEFGASTQDSGNVSYGVEIGRDRYFVKTAGSPDDPAPFLGHGDRVALLRNAVQVARGCGHPALPAFHGVLESTSGPILVYDWVDGELLGVPRASRDDPASAFQRFRRLPAPVITRALDVVYDLHAELARSGWIAVDFYDGSLLYDFAADRLAVVDVDNYHLGPFRNTVGRMFGSSRFMAPEEFELGAPIDERTNVYGMGRAASIFLADETLAIEAFRGPRALHGVVERACRRDRSERFGSMAEFCDFWRAARSTEPSTETR